MNPVSVITGDSPIVLGQPHSGTDVPRDIYRHLNELGQQLADTDWHIPQLYAGLLPDPTVVKAEFNRYVIDANRDPEGVSLYPGQNTTQLVPLTNFEGTSIWKTPPDENEIARRREEFHAVYHAALKEQIMRVKARHGFAVLYDCHSIRSEIPFLFEDQLPDLNIGDNVGSTCDPKITQALKDICHGQSKFSYVVNGRFRGGWTTRHYGRPGENIHAIQMELVQRHYLETEAPPFAYDAVKAEPLRILLADILHAIENLSLTHLTLET